MTQHQSIADQAVETIAHVRQMADDLELEHVERHAVREMKRIAESILIEAFRQARSLAFAADALREECRKVEKGQQ